MSRATVDLALAVFKDPGLLVDLRERPLPEDVGVAIRIAAGECAARDAAVADSGIPPDAVVEACVFFLQQTLFAPGSDSYRILGGHPGDPQERLREHYRWLMKWLHPDRNQDGWETLYADRVNAAWQDLKTPDRRAAYDSRLPAAAPAMVPTPTLGWRVPVSERAQRGPLLSGRIVRNLPGIVLGSLAAMAMLVVAATYWARTANERDRAARGSARDNPSAVATEEARPLPAPALPAPMLAGSVDTGAQPMSSAWDDEGAAIGPVPPVAMSMDLAAVTSALPADAGAGAAAPDDADASTRSDPPAVASMPAGADLQAPPAATPPATQATADPPVAMAAMTAQADIAASAPVGDPVPPPVRAAAPAAMRSAVTIAAAAPDPVPAQPPPPRTDAALDATIAAAPGPDRAAPSQPVAESRGQGVRTPRGRTEVPPAPLPASAPQLAVNPAAENPTGEGPGSVADQAPTGPVPARASAEALVREFVAAYAAGDRSRFDRLLSADGRGQATLIDMRRRLDTTDMRFLEITRVQWRLDSESARASASYRDTYVPRGSRKAVTEAGRIDWDIRIEDGDHRIAGIERNASR